MIEKAKGQIDSANEIFSPRQADYDCAELIPDAYAFHTSAAGGARGAVMLGDEMIDEASAKMAQVIPDKGWAAGMTRSSQ
jgi:citrate lyase subunit beta/citryl-CoA lyase